MKATWVAACAVLGMLALASDASAQGFKAYPAENCVRVSGAAISLNGGTIENNDTTQVLNIDCPLVSTRLVNGSVTAQLSFKDVSTTDGVRCTINAVDLASGNVFTFSNAKSSSAASFSSEWQIFVFDNLSTGNNEFYFINCKIPAKTANGRSSVGTYQMFER